MSWREGEAWWLILDCWDKEVKLATTWFFLLFRPLFPFWYNADQELIAEAIYKISEKQRRKVHLILQNLVHFWKIFSLHMSLIAKLSFFVRSIFFIFFDCTLIPEAGDHKEPFWKRAKKLFFGRQRFPAGRCWWRACLLLKNRTLPPPLPPSSFLCRSANVCTTACTASTNKPSTIPFSSHILTFIWHTKPHGSFWGTLTPYVAWWSISSKESFWKTDHWPVTNPSFSLIFLKGCRIWSLIPLWARFVNNWCIEGRRAECNATNYLGLWFKLSLRMVLLSFFPTARTAFPAAKTFQGGARKGERSVLGPTLILRFSSAWNKSWREKNKNKFRINLLKMNLIEAKWAK